MTLLTMLCKPLDVPLRCKNVLKPNKKQQVKVWGGEIEAWGDLSAHREVGILVDEQVSDQVLDKVWNKKGFRLWRRVQAHIWSPALERTKDQVALSYEAEETAG